MTFRLVTLFLLITGLASAKVGELYYPRVRTAHHKFERFVTIKEVHPQGLGLILSNGANCQFESVRVHDKIAQWRAGDQLSVFYSSDGHIASLYHPRTHVIIYP